MKNLSKALALALLLVPAVARADQWCHGDNQHIWTYASGQTPFTYLCLNGSSSTQAGTWAQTKCQQAWDNFASNYAIGGFVPYVYSSPVPGSTIMCRWNYRCRACVVGLLPHIFLEPRAQLGPAEAGHVAVSAVKGQVVSVELLTGGEADPIYLVDVVTDTGQVQVEVDATTGRARIVEADEEAGCNQ